jgi:hypothetical protein
MCKNVVVMLLGAEIFLTPRLQESFVSQHQHQHQPQPTRFSPIELAANWSFSKSSKVQISLLSEALPLL